MPVPMRLRSMTGFARVRRRSASGEITVTLRSVNHRGLDIHFHHPSEFALFENSIRGLIKRSMARGHVEVRISLIREEASQRPGYNRELLARFLAAFREANREFHLMSEPDLNIAFRLPGIFTPDTDGLAIDEALEPELTQAVSACLDELNSYREREGVEIGELLAEQAVSIRSQTEKMIALRERTLPEYQQRLEIKLRELLGNHEIEPRRLLEESALLADRSDIQEELARLVIHNNELTRMLAQGGEIGKKLDFLLQEMNRETNTVLSKTAGVGGAGLEITTLALATKANIEKVREQALNLE